MPRRSLKGQVMFGLLAGLLAAWLYLGWTLAGGPTP